MEIVVGGLKLILWLPVILFFCLCYLYVKYRIKQFKKEEEKQKKERERHVKFCDEYKSSGGHRAPADNNQPGKAER